MARWRDLRGVHLELSRPERLQWRIGPAPGKAVSCLSICHACWSPEDSMAHAPFPPDIVIRWRRLDVFGYEHARIQRVHGGWRFQGKVRSEERRVGKECRCAWSRDC